MRIQHNIMAMSAYRNYTNNVSAMKKNLEKLSSGYKINRAGDDAAGLAISEKMRAQITGLQTAQKNAKDGISLVQTAEGALTEVHDMLNRMVELATQSANGTYEGDTDRKQLQKEVDQLREEINRIRDSANFNGIKLLNGNLSGEAGSAASVETGEMTNVDLTPLNDGNMVTKTTTKGSYSIDLSNFTGVASGATNATVTVSITVGGVTIAEAATTGGESVKASDFKLSSAVSTAGTAGVTISSSGAKYEFSIDGDKITFTMVNDPTSDAQTNDDMTVAVVNAEASTPGGEQGNQAHPLSVKIDTPAVYAGERVYAHSSFSLATAFASGIKDGDALKIGDDTYVFAVGKDSKFKSGGIDLTAYSESDLESTSGAAFLEAAKKLTVAAAGNKQFKVTNDNASTTIDLVEKEGGFKDYSEYNLGGASGLNQQDGVWSKLVDGVSVSLVQTGKATNVEAVEAKGGLILQIGDTADEFNKLKVNINDIHCSAMVDEKTGKSIADISILDQDKAAEAIEVIKSAINYISDVRGTLGANQNRLEHTINNLSVMTENIQDAESTIRDVDIAEEMMAYTKNNILIQSAQAMLAQANQVPQGVLQLLQ